MLPGEFARAYCNWLPGQTEEGWRVIDRDTWERTRL
jgi:hypothetical protein